MASEAEHWGSRAGFVLATVGSAVGLGNIWRFGYVAGENGGGAFVIAFVAIVALVGLPLAIAELAIGRRGESDAVTTFERAAPRPPLRWLGWAGVFGCIAILSYYSVIAGWALRYAMTALVGGLSRGGDAAGHTAGFEAFIADPVAPVFWQAVILAASALVVAGGVRHGIERLNLWLMPLLAIIVIGLAAFALTLPGAWRGVTFLLAPSWHAFLSPGLYLAALGQAFFSIGLGMAIYVTYGSYLERTTPIPGSAAIVVTGDVLFSLVAALAIFPAVFALGGDPAAGPRLAFVVFPQILGAMPGGAIIGPVFFGLLAAAALTSMVSLLEVPVAYLVRRRDVARPRAVALIAGTIMIVGLPSALGYGPLGHVQPLGLPLLDLVDRAVSSLVLPIAGLGVAVIAGWHWSRKTALEAADFPDPQLGAGGLATTLGTMWLGLVRWLAPVAIGLILLGALGLV